ncbi:Putative ribonuclease H protein At1g65750 [Linum perenne]
MVTTEGEWDFNSLARSLPSEALDLVAGMTPPRAVAKDRLLTNEARFRRGLNQDKRFCRCDVNDESISHVLWDCDFAAETWKAAGDFDIRDSRWQMPFEEWFFDSIVSKQGLKFGVVCWFLWRARNEKIFSDGNDNPTTVAIKCQRWLVAIQNAQDVESQVTVGMGTKFQRQIAWVVGPNDDVTLNFDSSVLGRGGKAAAGGLIRDGYG